MVRNVTKSLDLTAAALAEDRSLPQEAVNLMARPIIPFWTYTFFGGDRLEEASEEARGSEAAS